MIFLHCYVNLAADGQNGAEANYAVDLMKANKLIFGKVLSYIYYGEEFRKVANADDSKLISNDGDIFDYINWNTPIVRLDTNKLDCGVYAGHSQWGVGVTLFLMIMIFA